MQMNTTRPGNLAFKQGLLFGLLLALFSIVFNVILSLAGLSTLFLGAILMTFTGIGYFKSIVELIVAILASIYAAQHFAIDTDIDHLISTELPWRKHKQEFDRVFPQRSELILVVIEASTPNQMFSHL